MRRFVELTVALGRSPSVAEIAERTDLTIEEALEVLEVGSCYRSRPLAREDADDGPADAAVSEVEAGFELAEARCVVSSLLRTLPTSRDRLVVELRFLHGLTQSDIAARIGVSQVQVSRLLRANLERMRRRATQHCQVDRAATTVRPLPRHEKSPTADRRRSFDGSLS